MTTQKKTTTSAVAKKTTPKKKQDPALAAVKEEGTPIDQILQQGDISSLTVAQRSEFLWKLAESMGLEPMTQPFQLITDASGKLTVYAKRTAADQLRRKHKIRSQIVEEGPLKIGDSIRDDVYCVKVMLMEPDSEGKYTSDSRVEFAVGCVGIAGLSDEALANCIMKCHTKAIRRGTLSMCGLGFLDELEVESIRVQGDTYTGPRRILPQVTAAPQPPSKQPNPQPAGDNTSESSSPAAPKPVVVLPPSKPPVETT